jgi:23S rRNA (cytosine1962-C5)-methyltransferase
MSARVKWQTTVTEALPPLQLKRHEERRLRAGHLWVFSNEVDVHATPLKGFEPGSIARVLSSRGEFLGYGYVNPAALIAARLLSRHEREPVNASLLRERLRAAAALRAEGRRGSHHRWVYGESDRVPGLVLDRFGDVVVGQIATLGMEQLKDELAAAVLATPGIRTLIWKNDGGARGLEQLPEYVEAVGGPQPVALTVEEALPGLRPLFYEVPVGQTQKTGWFYDQTDNRAQLARMMPAGARVLDICSYVGAWALTAMAAGATEALCVDASAGALEAAAANAARQGCQLATRRGDAFDVLQELAGARERFDVVIVDPPAFIKRRKDQPQGEAAYRKLNQLAMRLLNEGGLLVSCSCSWHLPPESLLAAVQSGARHLDRFAQVLHVGGQSLDHPIHPAIPETRYLKAFFARVGAE